VSVPLDANKGWEFWTLLVSDQHHDNPHADNDLELEHLREAKERGAAIISNGDTCCAMQGKYDKRSNKSAVRPEHQKDNYLDAVINTGADFYEPFAHHFVCFVMGNHEQSITDRHETRLIDRLVGILNDRTGSSGHIGGFSGFVVFSFGENSGRTTRVVLHYDHGYGGGGPVTDDMIQHQRRSTYLPDADIVCSGHAHGSFTREVGGFWLSHDGAIRHDMQTHVKLLTDKEECCDGSREGTPPPAIRRSPSGSGGSASSGATSGSGCSTNWPGRSRRPFPQSSGRGRTESQVEEPFSMHRKPLPPAALQLARHSTHVNRTVSTAAER
jgi:hypothetical protein